MEGEGINMPKWNYLSHYQRLISPIRWKDLNENHYRTVLRHFLRRAIRFSFRFRLKRAEISLYLIRSVSPSCLCSFPGRKFARYRKLMNAYKWNRRLLTTARAHTETRSAGECEKETGRMPKLPRRKVNFDDPTYTCIKINSVFTENSNKPIDDRAK